MSHESILFPRSLFQVNACRSRAFVSLHGAAVWAKTPSFYEPQVSRSPAAHRSFGALSGRSNTPKAGTRRLGRPELQPHTCMNLSQSSGRTILQLMSNIHGRQQRPAKRSHSSLAPSHRAFIAFGSNVGDRLNLIERACHALDAQDDIILRRTSSLWETKAMYVLDQGDFLNGVCEVETSLEPLALLDRLQSIEVMLNREKLIDKGPRTIDLDILLYDSAVVDEPRLSIPHKLMLERGFVLQPLCELIPQEKLPPALHDRSSFLDHLQRLAASGEITASTWMSPSPFAQPWRPLDPIRQTHVMSILNITPDSFSDGGNIDSADISALDSILSLHTGSGATILDVGGQSTRPNAADVGDVEEIERIKPVVRHIKRSIDQDNAKRNIAISIDTFRATVARSAVESGADIVNDVSGGLLDPEMLPTVAQLGCSVVLMHMRGDPATMSSKENTSYSNGLIETVGDELISRVQAAERAGVRRWRIMLDPGIGFAKNKSQNLELLRRFGELRCYTNSRGTLAGFPWVVGSSRKGFIGKITGVADPRERVWGTAPTVAAAVQGGADVVRVHDVREMVQVTKMSDAIWRV